jgi:hypothetical protein
LPRPRDCPLDSAKPDYSDREFDSTLLRQCENPTPLLPLTRLDRYRD